MLAAIVAAASHPLPTLQSWVVRYIPGGDLRIAFQLPTYCRAAGDGGAPSTFEVNHVNQVPVEFDHPWVDFAELRVQCATATDQAQVVQERPGGPAVLQFRRVAPAPPGNVRLTVQVVRAWDAGAGESGVRTLGTFVFAPARVPVVRELPSCCLVDTPLGVFVSPDEARVLVLVPTRPRGTVRVYRTSDWAEELSWSVPWDQNFQCAGFWSLSEFVIVSPKSVSLWRVDTLRPSMHMRRLPHRDVTAVVVNTFKRDIAYLTARTGRTRHPFLVDLFDADRKMVQLSDLGTDVFSSLQFLTDSLGASRLLLVCHGQARLYDAETGGFLRSVQPWSVAVWSVWAACPRWWCQPGTGCAWWTGPRCAARRKWLWHPAAPLSHARGALCTSTNNERMYSWAWPRLCGSAGAWTPSDCVGCASDDVGLLWTRLPPWPRVGTRRQGGSGDDERRPSSDLSVLH